MSVTQVTQCNILVVDDTPANLKLLTDLLMFHGYKVRPAINGRSALRAIQRLKPELILLDVIMPDMSGYEVGQILKADEDTSHIPIIFISALNATVDKVKAFECGGVDFITKPFQEDEVLARIRTHVTMYLLQHELEQQTVRFQMLSEAASEGVVIHEGERIVDVNRTCEHLFGYDRATFLELPLRRLFVPEFRELALAHLHTCDEQPYEARGQKREGTGFPVEVQMRHWRADGRQAQVTTIRDISLQKAMEDENRYLQNENVVLKSGIKDRYRLGDIIGKSQVMQELYELSVNTAASEHNVVICGESGTGKELVARTIHAMSSRQHQTFVPVNCGAVSEALFEREFFGHRKSAFTGADHDKPGFFDAAHQGTLFLDEVGELSTAMQVKLLRAIETGEYIPVGDNSSKHADLRIISATNRHLEVLLQQGVLRDDFFYRVHVIEIMVPPLRERKEDIPLLIEYFLKELHSEGQIQRLPAKVEEFFYDYGWPGNVRELQNKLKRYVSTRQVDLCSPSEFPASAAAAPAVQDPSTQTLHDAVEALEKQMITEALVYNHWHKGKTATMLDIPRKTLQRKMAKYNL
jgi:PAS domain S-box-containing protein